MSENVQIAAPTAASEVQGPTSGNTMTKAYVQAIGQLAYVWGWPLVNTSNRIAAASKITEPSVVGGLPLGYNGVGMLTDYISTQEKSVACPNQDVVYGTGFFDLEDEPAILQVPDFAERFWIYAIYDERTSEFSKIGKPYDTKPGFYMVVCPDWKGETPSGITAVLRSPTKRIFAIPRIFMDSTAEDRRNIQPELSQVGVYQLSKYDGKMKTTDWTKIPSISTPGKSDGGSAEMKWVVPDTFFDQLPGVMKALPPLPGEEALYGLIGSVLDAAAEDPEVMKTLKEAAAAAEKEMIDPLIEWQHVGRSAGNGWNSQVDNAAWGVDYLNRTASARSNQWENRPEETKYIFRDFDSAGVTLDGNNSYTVTFPKGQTPPVKGFWSMTLYNDSHFFNPNSLERYSLGTKNKSLQYGDDGSLTLYFGSKSPGKDKESNWLPAPEGVFSLYLRAYWPDESILDGSWSPPNVDKVS